MRPGLLRPRLTFTTFLFLAFAAVSFHTFHVFHFIDHYDGILARSEAAFDVVIEGIAPLDSVSTSSEGHSRTVAGKNANNAPTSSQGGSATEITETKQATPKQQQRALPTKICQRTVHAPPIPPPRNCSHTQIKTIGSYRRFGRTNNQLISIFHAIDQSRSEGDFLLGLEGWANNTMRAYFDLEGGNFEERLCLKDMSSITERERNQVGERLDSRGTFMRWSKIDVETDRRDMMGIMLRFVHPTLCAGMEELINSETISEGRKYVAVHLRWLEGLCPSLMNITMQLLDMTSDGSCYMAPSYIKGILRPLNLLNATIVVIGDGQRPRVLRALQTDTEIGSRIVTLSANVSSVENDFMVATLADYFIGVPVSTMSGNIARARVALGFRPDTNFVYVAEDNTVKMGGDTTIHRPGEKSWKVCEECAFSRVGEMPHRGGPLGAWKTDVSRLYANTWKDVWKDARPRDRFWEKR